MALLLLCLVQAPSPAGGQESSESDASSPSLRGQTLTQALLGLEERGLSLVFTSEVVKPEWRVLEEPRAAEPRAVLDELLTPWGLGVRPGPDGRLVIVRPDPGGPARLRGRVVLARSGTPLPGVRLVLPSTGGETVSGAEGRFELHDVPLGPREIRASAPGFTDLVERVTLKAGMEASIELPLEPVALSLEQVVVSPSLRTILLEEPISGSDVDREQLLSLPGSSQDSMNAIPLLPGTSSDDLSSRFQIRGGRADEVLVMVDGVELYEPYHLRDFGRPLSLVDPGSVERMDLVTGAFSTEYGDRMGGVLDVTTRTPDATHHFLGVGRIRFEGGTAGTFDDGRGKWLSSVRVGLLDRATQVYDTSKDPQFADLFGKLDFQLRPAHALHLQALASQDGFDYDDRGTRERPPYSSVDHNSTYWLTGQSGIGRSFWVDTVLSWATVRRDREGIGNSDDENYLLEDRRDMSAPAISQDWLWNAGTHQLLKWGFQARRQDVSYDYMNLVAFDDPLAQHLRQPTSGTRFDEDLDGHQYAVYFADRFRLFDELTVEVGARWDASTVLEESYVSPRINVAWTVSGNSVIRAGWGYFYQSQRPYEIQVEDGVTHFFPDERAEHRNLGFEHLFRSGERLRVEAYERLIREPRPRFENLYDPVSVFPEIEPDRVELLPLRGRSRGIELSLGGSRGTIDWWASYAWSQADEEIEGRIVPRNIDERHAVGLALTWHPTPVWTLGAAWRYHSGWPTTALSAWLIDGEIVPVLGPLYGERMPSYHRLDLRASREWRLPVGTLDFALDLENVYDRGNVRGYGFDFEIETVGPDGNGPVEVERWEKYWGGFYPSFSLRWGF